MKMQAGDDPVQLVREHVEKPCSTSPQKRGEFHVMICFSFSRNVCYFNNKLLILQLNAV